MASVAVICCVCDGTVAGHFGCVYRGFLMSTEQKTHSLVAVKTLRHVDGNECFLAICIKYISK